MVKSTEFSRGDIVLVGFDPASGHEQKGVGRPALVLSVSAFNRFGMVLVAPITQGETMRVMPDLPFRWAAKRETLVVLC